MRGIVIQPKKEHKTQGSIALKKPSSLGQDEYVYSFANSFISQKFGFSILKS